MGTQRHSFKKRLELAAGRIALKTIQRVVGWMPLGMARRLGAGLGSVAYRLSRRYRGVSQRNLRAAFPEWSNQQVAQTARRVFQNFGMSMIEFFKSPSLSHEKIAEQIEMVGWEHFDYARTKQKGLLLITAHFGNWEWLAQYAVHHGLPLSVIARDTDDPSTTDLINQLREKSGYKVFVRGNTARYVLSCLKKNEAVAMLPDQRGGDVIVEFFGRKVGCSMGPALFHRKTGAPIVCAFGIRKPDGSMRLEICPPIENESTEDSQSDHQRIMQAIYDHLERYVRQYPDQWLWLHDRWKHAQPPLNDKN